jgi:DNA gyrase/topoisomerase IV subunit B
MDTYTSNDIKVLDELTHIRLNPGMYIGDTSTPTHLIEEALDNSLDECFGGHATIVAINIDTKTKRYSVIDNGRGLPYEDDVPVVVSTKLFSGAKFKGTKTAYKISCGMHGIGIVTICALSTDYDIEIYRDKRAKFVFKNSKLESKIIEDFTGEKPFSTKVSFIPDSKIFANLDIDVDRIRKRLLVASAELPNTHFVLNIDKSREIIKVDKVSFFKAACLKEDEKEGTCPITLNCKVGIEQFNVTFCYVFDGSVTPRIISSVNLLPVESGGTHVNIFFDLLREYFSAKAKKKNIRIQPGDSLVGLRAYISLDLINPEFSSQTKDRLITKKESLGKLSATMKYQLESFFESEKGIEVLNDALTFFAKYRATAESKNVKLSTGIKRSSTKFTKLKDCKSTSGELYVCEGDSAGGSIASARDSNIHAILPLRGKIPSIATTKEILKNKEISELIQSLGCGVGPNFDISRLRYKKIICAADADPDGKHIACLLTMVLAILVPEVVKKGYFYLAETPLYAIVNSSKKTFIPIWTDQELTQAKGRGDNILRFKGLGELDPWQLKICLLDEKTRRLTKIEYSSDIKKILKLFTDVEEKKKLLNS